MFSAFLKLKWVQLLLVASLAFATVQGSIREDGFTFDLTDDLEFVQPIPPPTIESNGSHHEAAVGKLFHLALPKQHHHKKGGFIAKSLPHWLIFNKQTGAFWGIPLPGDEETVHISVSLSPGDAAQNIVIQVVGETNDKATTTQQCKPNEDKTVLTLLLDKSLRAIKPKQRVVAVNNVAKFFRLPYSAFTMKPQYGKDDITDSSVVLAGPGNIQSKSSKSTSYMEVLVGCDGRLWEAAIPLIRNLKQQAKDGTIAEVLRLPLIGWRVKTDTRPALRKKRQAVDDYGSGDYDEEYYGEYGDDDYNEGDDLGDVEGDPPVSKKTTTLPASTGSTLKSTTTKTVNTSPTSTTTQPSSTHPHRHHHGEAKLSEEYSPDFTDFVEGDEDEENEEEPLLPKAVTQTPITTSKKPQLPLDTGPTKFDIPKPPDFADGDNYDYDTYEDEDDTDDDPVESETIVPEAPKIVHFITTQRSTVITESDVVIEDVVTEVETTVRSSSTTTTTAPTTASSSTTTSTTEAPTTFAIVEDTESPIFTVAAPVTTMDETTATSERTATVVSSSTVTQQSTTSITSTSTSTLPVTTEEEQLPDEMLPTTQPPTSVLPAGSNTIEEEQTPRVTTPRHISTTVIEEILKPDTLEPVDRYIPPEPQNTKPYIERRLQYKTVTAGKVFRYEIPKNTFKDAEDGYNLTIKVLDKNEQPLSRESWLQFNPTRRELYGLPLADDVSNWVYIIRASDKEGAYEQDELTVQVQQHRLERVLNQEFTLNLRIEKPQEYPHYVDWSLKVLRALGRIYGTNMSEITVRYINRTTEPVVFVWSNDSLPTSYCPRSQIEELFKILTANDRGDPSRELSVLLAPDLRVKKVLSKDLTTCEQQPMAPITPATNFSPILRNPVDQINATLGELLIFKVKEDTFYDPEDQDLLSLNLYTADHEEIPPDNWLQFDWKNREIYGIPRKTGREGYILVCVDSGSLRVHDSLEVVVHPTTKRHYNVEFSMTIGVPFETFSQTAAMQRKFVERLMEIFEESTPSNLHFLPFKRKNDRNDESTIVYWFNKSLPVETCPTEEIKRLESMLHSDSRSISSRVHRIMDSDFPVSTIKVHHIGNCKAKPQHVPIPTHETAVPSEESPRSKAENDIMITLILPIIIIAIMLFVAFVAACILYRKRKMGKMNMEEDGRQSYGNKGIPVIFQEELEEKPESGTKAPVILKDEKPPLAPPEYSKSGSLKLEDSEPYQPPPPFTRTQDNGRQPRPKPTPTYRKPPPYVPP